MNLGRYFFEYSVTFLSTVTRYVVMTYRTLPCWCRLLILSFRKCNSESLIDRHEPLSLGFACVWPPFPYLLFIHCSPREQRWICCVRSWLFYLGKSYLSSHLNTILINLMWARIGTVALVINRRRSKTKCKSKNHEWWQGRSKRQWWMWKKR